ncbi:alpha/beta hydrolase-fold protein [Tenacibaculum sp. TC6]|uniref:alpha/beta hydrolase-fold protein n=1 Tax=Tenacibaculum sp. TC6 TaxID=3423223 RepID=UPI003D3654F1
MKATYYLIFLLLTSNIILGQKYLNYSNDSLKINSTFLKETITLNLHLPETYRYAAATTKYPITIIFDSQHQRVYPQIIHSIDLLTSESQMPETIIIGIPFNRNNRHYLTSNQKIKGDILSGIERMEKFLFEELLPLLKKQYRTNDFTIVTGHSRSAFLVNYLITKRSHQINTAIALSGFFSNKPLSIQQFKAYISDEYNFPHLVNYYFSAGTTTEENTYLTEDTDLSNYLTNHKTATNFKGHFFETKNTNHMTNYWVSFPPFLMDCFSDYNLILDNWFYHKLKGKTITNPIEEFKSDLKNVSIKLGFKVNPNLTHLFSLASHYGYEKKDYNTAINFLKLGQKYYPDYPDFELDFIEYYKLLNNSQMVDFHKQQYTNKILSRKDISNADKEKLLQNLIKE